MNRDNKQTDVDFYLHKRLAEQKSADLNKFENKKDELWSELENEIDARKVLTAERNTKDFRLDLLVSAAVAALILTNVAMSPEVPRMADAIKPGITVITEEIDIEALDLRYGEFSNILQKTGADVFSTLKAYRKP